MNTKSISGAAKVICARMGRPNAVGATIAVALDAGGWLHTDDTATELVRLRLLLNAQPAELSEAQLEALIDSGNGALNDYYHERACSCSEWPGSCASSGDYFVGFWDTDAFAIGAAAVVGMWESMRAPAEVDEIARLRDRVAELESARRTPAGLSEAELSRTASGAYRCVCGHWDNVHGPFCFAEVCKCFRFAHPQPVEDGAS